jgi:4-diphosphocytidyl-2-C-methyl-D-erythritol kinase
MIVFSNAKINMGLRVLDKRADGYHNLKSVFYPLPLYDIIEIRLSENDEIRELGITIDAELESNLIFKAINLLRTIENIPPLSVFIYKQIPVGAGLGGGSSNAAAILTAIDKLFKLNLNKLNLHKLAICLGSDVPFFLENTPKLVSGRGDILEDIKLHLFGYYVLLVFDNIFISTAEAFKHLSKSEKQLEEDIKLANFIFDGTNDFEDYVFLRYPKLKQIKEEMYSNGALYASMSGSGSSIYGLFSSKPDVSFVEKYYFWRLIPI